MNKIPAHDLWNNPHGGDPFRFLGSYGDHMFHTFAIGMVFQWSESRLVRIGAITGLAIARMPGKCQPIDRYSGGLKVLWGGANAFCHLGEALAVTGTIKLIWGWKTASKWRRLAMAPAALGTLGLSMFNTAFSLRWTMSCCSYDDYTSIKEESNLHPNTPLTPLSALLVIPIVMSKRGDPIEFPHGRSKNQALHLDPQVLTLKTLLSEEGWKLEERAGKHDVEYKYDEPGGTRWNRNVIRHPAEKVRSDIVAKLADEGSPPLGRGRLIQKNEGLAVKLKQDRTLWIPKALVDRHGLESSQRITGPIRAAGEDEKEYDFYLTEVMTINGKRTDGVEEEEIVPDYTHLLSPYQIGGPLTHGFYTLVMGLAVIKSESRIMKLLTLTGIGIARTPGECETRDGYNLFLKGAMGAFNTFTHLLEASMLLGAYPLWLEPANRFQFVLSRLGATATAGFIGANLIISTRAFKERHDLHPDTPLSLGSLSFYGTYTEK